jgi:hypothetical protein
MNSHTPDQPAPNSPAAPTGVVCSDLFGLLFRLQCGEPTPLMELLAMPEVEREEAKRIALREVLRPDWCGPMQVIFMHRDGVIELWDRELREGWPNDQAER